MQLPYAGNGRVNETGLAAITGDGIVVDAGRSNGLAQTLALIGTVSGTGESHGIR